MKHSPTLIRAWHRTGAAAEQARENRKPVASDNPFLAAQQTFSDQIVKLLESFRETTEKASEAMFLAIYGSPALQAAVGVDPEVRPATEAGKIPDAPGTVGKAHCGAEIEDHPGRPDRVLLFGACSMPPRRGERSTSAASRRCAEFV